MEGKKILTCGHCGKPLNKLTSEVNRAIKMGMRLYCNRTCSGKGRRKSDADKKERTWWYDAFNRLAVADEIRIKKAAYFKRDYEANPEKYRLARQSQRDNHRRHISTPTYKKWKQGYDQKYLAHKKYGEFSEAVLVLRQIEAEIDKCQSRQDRNCHNKTQKRKRLWKNLQRSI
jgi:hypothetical protein